MAKEFKYKSEIQQGEIVQSWHVSQSVEAFSAASGVQEDYDISVSGSFKVTGSVYVEPSLLLNTPQNYYLSYNNTTGQVFKAQTGLSGTSVF